MTTPRRNRLPAPSALWLALWLALCGAQAAQDSREAQPWRSLAQIAECDSQGQPPAGQRQENVGFVSAPAVYLAPGRDRAGSVPAQDDGASEMPRLPVGVELVLECRSGSMVSVIARTGTRPSGWVRADQFEFDRPQAGKLLAALEALPAGATAQRLDLAQRALDLEPLNPAPHRALIQALQASGDARALAAARARLAAMAGGTVLRQAGEPQLIFINIQEAIMPLAALRHGELQDIYGDGASETSSFDMDATGFQPGRILYLQAAGAQSKIQVLGLKESYCDGTLAAIQPFDGNSSEGIATNYPLRPSPAPQAPAAALYLKMNAFIDNVLRRHGVRQAERQGMRLEPSAAPRALEAFAAIPVQGGAGPMLVASVGLEARKKSYALTVIAEAGRDGRYRLSYQDFRSGGLSESLVREDTFFQSADLDGDGVDELILHGSGYEWGHYYVLKKDAGQWRKLPVTASDGC